MARPRPQLQARLSSAVSPAAVYFQPPENLRLTYPCLVYSRDRSWDIWADDSKYLMYKGYMLTYISKNPDDPNLDRLESLPMCTYSRHYVADNLNHDVFIIYF